jgi:hypothetical protein
MHFMPEAWLESSRAEAEAAAESDEFFVDLDFEVPEEAREFSLKDDSREDMEEKRK